MSDQGQYVSGLLARRGVANAAPQLPLLSDSNGVSSLLRSRQGAIPTLPQQRFGFGDLVENLWFGAAQGALLVPDSLADAPDNPNSLVQLIGVAGGAIGEGALTQSYLLRGLQALSKTGRFAPAAKKALRAFGVGEKVDLLKTVTGSALLGATVEGGLRAVSGGDFQEIATGAGLAAIPGAAIGAGVAGFRVAKTAQSLSRYRRAIEDLPTDLRSKIDESVVMPERGNVLEQISQSFNRTKESFKDAFHYEHTLKKFSGFDPLVPEVDLADEFHILTLKVNRAQRQATEDLAKVFEPLHALPKERANAAAQDFMHLVIFRGLKETADRGLKTGSLSLDDISETLAHLEARVAPEVRQAAETHRTLVHSLKNELIARGRLPEGAGYDDYYPHHVLQTLADAEYKLSGGTRKELPTGRSLLSPDRKYVKEREGTARAIAGDYVDVMNHALKKFYRDNAVDDFLRELEGTHAIPIASLPDDVRRTLSSFGNADTPNGRIRRVHVGRLQAQPEQEIDDVFQAVVDDAMDLAGPQARAVGDELTGRANPLAARAEAKGRQMVELEERIAWLQKAHADEIDTEVKRAITTKIGRLTKRHEQLASESTALPPREIILPDEIAQRLDRYYQPDPLYVRKGPVGLIRKITAEWKYNTIWWGLTRFATFQILGDSTNALRSFPGIFARIKDGKIESAALKAIQAQFAHYRTPMMGTQQILGSLGMGGAGAIAAGEDATTAERWAAAVTGAGLGYMIGTARSAGSAKPRAHLARLYEDADHQGAINSGFVFSEEDLARRTLGKGGENLGDFGKSSFARTKDTALTLLSGKTHGDPYFFARGFSEAVEVIQTERENWLRLAGYIHQIEDGIAPKLAAKRAAAALVDYSRFSDFENKVVRGFMLPFYSFYRHNIPNWLKTTVGRDVGGKGKIALAAGAGIASFDLAAQLWNERYFPEIEKNLDPYLRNQFHIIMGDPTTGEAFANKNGQPMVFGVEMPYEMALEMLGLARPGMIYSEFFGMPIEHNESLVQRAFNIDAFESLPAPLKRPLIGMSNQFIDLLTPVLKMPAEIASNRNWHFGSPIVPERYRGTPEAWGMVLDHMARTAFRQYREFARTSRQVEQGGYDPLTSAFGLGAPINYQDMDRLLQSRLHERMRAATEESQKSRSKWMKAIDDLMGQREEPMRVLPTEGRDLQRIITEQVDFPQQIESAIRYYIERSSKAALHRHFESLSMTERARFLSSLEGGDATAFMFYLNGGTGLTDRAENASFAGGARGLTGF